MPSHSQLDANRANARLSTGPRTGPGKAASSQNNLRHGFRSQAVVLPGEDPAEFDDLLDQLTQHFAPTDLISQRCVAEMAGAEWCLARVRRLLNDALAENIAAVAELHPGASPDRLQRLAVETLNESRTSFSTWLRYEAKYQRDYERAYQTWAAYRKDCQTSAIKNIDAYVFAPMPGREIPQSASAQPRCTFEPNAGPPTPRSASFPAAPDSHSSAVAAKAPLPSPATPPESRVPAERLSAIRF